MNEVFQAIILGIVQGLTEFLPISSTGHLIVIPQILGWEGVVSTLSFDLALHVGTVVAVLGFFWRDWARLITGFAKALPKGSKKVWEDVDSRLFVLLIIGSIPAGLIGALVENIVENSLRSTSLVGASMLAFAFVLYWADRVSGQRQLSKVALSDSLSVGLAQVLALIPGVSRSGITITAGLLRGLDRESATRFSFLLSTPVIIGAALFKFKDIVGDKSFAGQSSVFLAGALAAAVSGWFAIKILLKFVQRHNFTPFVIYRIVVGVLLLIVGSKL